MEQLLSEITPSYGGLGFYYRDVASMDWTQETYTNTIDSSGFPVTAFLDVSGNDLDFIVSQSANNGGFWFKGSTRGETLNTKQTLLNTFSGQEPILADGGDGNRYVSDMNNELASINGDGSLSATTFTTGGTIKSMVDYKDRLAIANTKQNQSTVEFWNVSSLCFYPTVGNW